MFTNGPRYSILAGILSLGTLLMSGCGGGESPAPPVSATSPRNDAAAGVRAGDSSADAQDRAVISEVLPYAEVGDELVYGYFVAPSDMFEPLPAVIMIHEWWGLNDGVRAAADRLAAEGYIVLAVDLFGGKTAATPSAARELMLGVVEDPEAANQNIRGAYEFVSATAGAPSVAALGWRFGGTWSLNTAMLFPDELDAAVIYYGPVTDDEERLRPVGAPILGLFAADDISVKTESVRAFEAALTRLRKDFAIHVYDDARQGFANANADSYDPAVAEDAWRRTLAFLRSHLPTAADSS